MSLYCLIHGSAHGPEGWGRVARELERSGHEVVIPALPIGQPEASATEYVDAIGAAFDAAGADPTDAVAVGHSASGMFLPLVAARWCVRRMVFLAAIIPRVGMSVMEQIRRDAAMFNADWVGKDPMEDDVALHFEFHDCPKDRIDWALSVRIPFYAKRAMTEKSPLSKWPDTPASYIACTEDRTLSPDWQKRAARERLGTEAIKLSSGHCPQIGRPAELARIIENITQI